MNSAKLLKYLDEKVGEYNSPAFIKDDPISIPHLFSKKQDIEISGFFTATLAWGNRKTIIRKCRELMEMMDYSPHDFILTASGKELARLAGFKHRTFNPIDLFYFIDFFKWYFSGNQSLETAFSKHLKPGDINTENALIGFHDLFFSLPESPMRTRKHVPTPARNSSCKRINMFLRWMVRKDNAGVDFGIWKSISPSQLVCPVDLHVERVARRLGLMNSKQVNWKAAVELTQRLKEFDPSDPVKYDFALFGIGANERIQKTGENSGYTAE